MSFINAFSKRRSNYDLLPELPINFNELEQLLAQVIEASPTGFNSQSSRMIILHGSRHQQFWDLVLEGIKKEIGDTPAYLKSEAKITTLRRSFGTILFYEDDSVNDELRKKFPLYANHVTTWAEQSQGMLQLAVWTALADVDIGASLQHYTELVDLSLKQALDINPTWRLVGQMPFGKPQSLPEPKSKQPGKTRVKSYK